MTVEPPRSVAAREKPPPFGNKKPVVSFVLLLPSVLNASTLPSTPARTVEETTLGGVTPLFIGSLLENAGILFAWLSPIVTVAVIRGDRLLNQRTVTRLIAPL